jgi:hypothetical protein
MKEIHIMRYSDTWFKGQILSIHQAKIELAILICDRNMTLLPIESHSNI